MSDQPAPEQGEAQERCGGTRSIPFDSGPGEPRVSHRTCPGCPDCKQGEAASEERDAYLRDASEGFRQVLNILGSASLGDREKVERAFRKAEMWRQRIAPMGVTKYPSEADSVTAVSPAPPEAALVCPTCESHRRELCNCGDVERYPHTPGPACCPDPFHDTPLPADQESPPREPLKHGSTTGRVEARLCPTCGLGVYLGWKKRCPDLFHSPEESAEERWTEEELAEAKRKGTENALFFAKAEIKSLRADLAALQAERDKLADLVAQAALADVGRLAPSINEGFRHRAKQAEARSSSLEAALEEAAVRFERLWDNLALLAEEDQKADYWRAVAADGASRARTLLANSPTEADE